jgi:hypothetical protein
MILKIILKLILKIIYASLKGFIGRGLQRSVLKSMYICIHISELASCEGGLLTVFSESLELAKFKF